MSSARNAGESAIYPVCAQPSAEVVRVERAKCRREYDLSHTCATLCGEHAGREREKNARGRICGAGRYIRTGEGLLVQLEYAEYVGSWKMRTGDLVVQL